MGNQQNLPKKLNFKPIFQHRHDNILYIKDKFKQLGYHPDDCNCSTCKVYNEIESDGKTVHDCVKFGRKVCWICYYRAYYEAYKEDYEELYNRVHFFHESLRDILGESMRCNVVDCPSNIAEKEECKESNLPFDTNHFRKYVDIFREYRLQLKADTNMQDELDKCRLSTISLVDHDNAIRQCVADKKVLEKEKNIPDVNEEHIRITNQEFAFCKKMMRGNDDCQEVTDKKLFNTDLQLPAEIENFISFLINNQKSEILQLKDELSSCQRKLDKSKYEKVELDF